MYMKQTFFSCYSFVSSIQRVPDTEPKRVEDRGFFSPPIQTFQDSKLRYVSLPRDGSEK